MFIVKRRSYHLSDFICTKRAVIGRSHGKLGRLTVHVPRMQLRRITVHEMRPYKLRGKIRRKWRYWNAAQVVYIVHMLQEL